MNICIESFVLNHHRRSGLMTYTEGLIQGLYKNDTQNDYTLAYYSLHRKAEQMPGPSGYHFHKEVLKIPDRDFWQRQFFIDQVALPLFLKAKKIQVFHRPSGYTMPSLKNIFKIMTIHDLRTLTIGDKFWKQNIADYQKTVNTLNICVVVSECTKQDLLKHFPMDEKKIKVIYLGADKRFQPSSQENMKRTLNKYQLNEPFLLSLGSVPRKNINGIIRGFAASKSKTNHILVLGCNYDIQKYTQLADSLGVAGRIRILDHMGDDEIVSLYSGCRAFVFPSLYEGFGLPILEAFGCQAPVITSNVSSCPEVAGDAAILVDPNNPQEIAEAMDEFCQNDRLRQTMIQKGIQRGKLFNWDKYSGEIQKIYELA